MERYKEINIGLTEKEKHVLELRKTHTLQQIADRFGLSRERIRQIIKEIKKKRRFKPKNGIDFLCSTIKRALKSSGIKTLEEAQSKTDKELLDIRLIGKKALKLIRNCKSI